ncbi:MAG TPA: LysM peptidoglycan-binding domain-containing protein [Tepidiformaceae bacterium]|jgi:LysM repeat protein|nr:LysM peptidoglycan-binding domain-containing protein [Tepidiformaceae bacterium]
MDGNQRNTPSGTIDEPVAARSGNGAPEMDVMRRARPFVLLGLAAVALVPALAFALQQHTVLPGETLSAIADQYGFTVDDLATVNNLTDPNLIFAGQTLEIGAEVPAAYSPPSSADYTVADGDTVTSIADHFGITVDALLGANTLTDPNIVLTGQDLSIPLSSGIVPMVTPGSLNTGNGEIVRQAEAEYGLPTGLLQALAWQESGWQQGITSDAGAMGITQIVPDTADWALNILGVDAANWQTSVTDNARMGAAILAFYMLGTGNDEHLSLAAYYQGWQSVQDIGILPETEAYVDNVLAMVPLFQ